MRKSLVIVLGCILIGGLVMATPTAPEPQLPNVTVEITCDPETDGVDTPWFELDISDQNTVKWHNAANQSVHIVWQGQRSPISWQEMQLAPNGETAPEPTNKSCKSGWPQNKICRAYKYSLVCTGNPTKPIIDPGGGIRP